MCPTSRGIGTAAQLCPSSELVKRSLYEAATREDGESGFLSSVDTSVFGGIPFGAGLQLSPLSSDWKRPASVAARTEPGRAGSTDSELVSRAARPTSFAGHGAPS